MTDRRIAQLALVVAAIALFYAWRVGSMHPHGAIDVTARDVAFDASDRLDRCSCPP